MSAANKSIIRRLLEKYLCRHKWEEFAETKGKRPNGTIAFIRETLICSECGKIKQIDI